MALRIIIIDPNQEWLKSAKKFFLDKGYEVDVADTGKAGQLLIYNSVDLEKPYFYVVLNLEVQNHTGPQVMKFIKSKHPTLNVCLILENDELLKDGSLTMEQLARLGAQEVMAKPFEMEDLLGKLEGNQSMGQLISHLKKNEGISEVEDVSIKDESFTFVPIDRFFPNKNVLFDVFIKIGQDKYLKILRSGDSFSKDRIENYKKEKGVTHLYFHSRDRKKYIRFCNFLATKMIKANTAGTGQVKIGLLKATAEMFLEEISTEGLKPQALSQGKEICENLFNMIESDKDLWQILKEFQDFDASAFAHSYLVCLFSSMIVKQFDWQSKATIETVAMAALFHDIGKVALPKELLDKRPDEMNPEELKHYMSHPELGKKIVEGNKMITNSVKQVIMQHHERSDGTGFPEGLKDPKLLTLSKIIILADFFSHYVAENEVTPIVALKKVLTNSESIKKFNGVVLEKFMHVFIDPSKKKRDTELQSNSKVVKAG